MCYESPRNSGGMLSLELMGIAWPGSSMNPDAPSQRWLLESSWLSKEMEAEYTTPLHLSRQILWPPPTPPSSSDPTAGLRGVWTTSDESEYNLKSYQPCLSDLRLGLVGPC